MRNLDWKCWSRLIAQDMIRKQILNLQGSPRWRLRVLSGRLTLEVYIKLSLCGTSWDVILFPRFRIDQRITKESAGSRSAFSCFFTGSKITVSEGEHFWVSYSFEHWWVCHWPFLLRAQDKNGILSSFEVLDYSSSWIWKNWERIDTEYEISGLVQVASCIKLAMSWRYKWGSNFSSSDSRNFLGVEWGSIGV